MFVSIHNIHSYDWSNDINTDNRSSVDIDLEYLFRLNVTSIVISPKRQSREKLRRENSIQSTYNNRID